MPEQTFSSRLSDVHSELAFLKAQRGSRLPEEAKYQVAIDIIQMSAEDEFLDTHPNATYSEVQNAKDQTAEDFWKTVPSSPNPETVLSEVFSKEERSKEEIASDAAHLINKEPLFSWGERERIIQGAIPSKPGC